MPTNELRSERLTRDGSSAYGSRQRAHFRVPPRFQECPSTGLQWDERAGSQAEALARHGLDYRIIWHARFCSVLERDGPTETLVARGIADKDRRSAFCSVRRSKLDARKKIRWFVITTWANQDHGWYATDFAPRPVRLRPVRKNDVADLPHMSRPGSPLVPRMSEIAPPWCASCSTRCQTTHPRVVKRSAAP
jgi:hypothetical protein